MQQTATLEDTEWSQLMAILANAQGSGITWAMVNPLLMKLGQQLQAQQGQATQMVQRGDGLDHDSQTPDLPDHIRRRGQRAPQ